MKIIKPQAGFQMQFLSSPADIVIGGGAAGAGKTFALLMEPLRHILTVRGYGGIIFRRTSPQIDSEGGLWDTSTQLYMSLGDKDRPRPTSQPKKRWTFPNGNKLEFRHLEHEKNRFDYQGAQIPFIAWDELTHFTKDQFFYLLSRNRSTCGVRPIVRATCNPESHGWVKDLISWFIYPDDYHIETLQGYPIAERVGKLRYFLQDKNTYVWGNTVMEVVKKAPHIFTKELLQGIKESGSSISEIVKSITFIPGTIYQNKLLLKHDPSYLGNLLSQSEEEKSKLLGGCWKMLKGEDELFEYAALKCLHDNDFVAGAKTSRDKYITADIALEGADKFVIMVWHGWRVVEVVTMDKSTADVVIAKLRELMNKHSVPQYNLIYDADGVGNFVKGFIKHGRPFHGGSSPVKVNREKEFCDNLRTQCYYHLSYKINEYGIYIEPKQYEAQIVQELNATRKRPYDGKSHKILSKAEIKLKLSGRSPDFADCIMMRMLADIAPKKVGALVDSL